MRSPSAIADNTEDGERRYLLDTRIRNYKVVAALREIGHTPLSFAKAHALDISDVYGLVNMTASPFAMKRVAGRGNRCVPDESEYSKVALTIMLETRKPFDALFNEQQALRPLSRNTSARSLSEADVTGVIRSLPVNAVAGLEDPPDIEDQVDGSFLQKEVRASLKTLPSQEAEVLSLRYLEELSLDETGARLGVCKERVRQIEGKGLRQLRHPSRSEKLRGFLDVGDGDCKRAPDQYPQLQQRQVTSLLWRCGKAITGHGTAGPTNVRLHNLILAAHSAALSGDYKKALVFTEQCQDFTLDSPESDYLDSVSQLLEELLDEASLEELNGRRATAQKSLDVRRDMVVLWATLEGEAKADMEIAIECVKAWHLLPAMIWLKKVEIRCHKHRKMVPIIRQQLVALGAPVRVSKHQETMYAALLASEDMNPKGSGS